MVSRDERGVAERIEFLAILLLIGVSSALLSVDVLSVGGLSGGSAPHTDLLFEHSAFLTFGLAEFLAAYVASSDGMVFRCSYLLLIGLAVVGLRIPVRPLLAALLLYASICAAAVGFSFPALQLVLALLFVRSLLLGEVSGGKRRAVGILSVLLLFPSSIPLAILLGVFLYGVPSDRFTRGGLSLVFVLGSVILSLSPTPETATIPEHARLVESRSLNLHGTDPYFGSSPGIQAIDREAARETLVLPVLLVLVWGLSLLRTRGEVHPTLVNRALLLWGAIFLDIGVMPDSVSVIGPVYTLERLLPSQMYSPLSLPLIHVLVFVTASLLVSAKRGSSFSYLKATLFLSVPPLAAIFGNLLSLSSADTPSLSVHQRLAPIWRHLEHAPEDLFSNRVSFLQPAVLPLDSKYCSVPLPNEVGVVPGALSLIRASVRGEELTTVIDSNLSGEVPRWNAKRHERAWFLLRVEDRLPESSVLVMRTPPPSTDFPGSLRVSFFSSDCVSPSCNVLLDFSPWRGVLCESSAPSSIRYLKHESVIRVPVPEGFRRGVIRVERTDSNAFFDWSLTGLSIVSAESRE